MYVVEEEDALAHYGVKGMRWGVKKHVITSEKRSDRQRKAYNKTKNPSKASMMLNYLESGRAQSKYDADRFEKKAAKAKEGTKRKQKYLTKVLNNRTYQKRIENKIETTINKLSKQKLDVVSKSMKIPVQTARSTITSFCGGFVGGLVLAPVTVAVTTATSKKVSGNYYTVRRKDDI